ncbi:MAG: hypothetical protein Hals2KO_21470 [Halioglobus sp.]
MSEPTYLPEGYVVVGDSNVSARGSWGDLLRDSMPSLPFCLDAHSGRDALNYQLSPQFKPVKDYGSVIYSLGTADVILEVLENWDLSGLEDAYRNTFSDLVSRGYDLRVIIPAGLPCPDFIDGSARMRTACRNAAQAHLPANRIFDFKDVWPWERNHDGLHLESSAHEDTIFPWVRDYVLA